MASAVPFFRFLLELMKEAPKHGPAIGKFVGQNVSRAGPALKNTSRGAKELADDVPWPDVTYIGGPAKASRLDKLGFLSDPFVRPAGVGLATYEALDTGSSIFNLINDLNRPSPENTFQMVEDTMTEGAPINQTMERINAQQKSFTFPNAPAIADLQSFGTLQSPIWNERKGIKNPILESFEGGSQLDPDAFSYAKDPRLESFEGGPQLNLKPDSKTFWENAIKEWFPPVSTAPEQSKESQNAQPEIEVYTVKSGDTLWAIAEQYLGDGRRWKELGYHGDPRQLQIGTQLRVPKRNTYKVQAGDTLWDIAERHLGDGRRWKELGYIGDPRMLQIGTELVIPNR